MNEPKLRRTLVFVGLAIAFAASIFYDTLFARMHEGWETPIAAMVLACLGMAFVFHEYHGRDAQPLLVSMWPLHLFTISFVVVCVAFHGGDRLGQVVAYTLVSYATYAVLPLILATDLGLLRAFARLIALASAGLAIPSLCGSLGYRSFAGLPLHLKPHYADLSGIVASGGVFEHGEGHALQMAAGMLCCLYVIRHSGGVFYIFCFLLATAGLIVSQGRAAMLGIVVAFAVRILPEFIRRSPPAFLGSLTLVLIFPFVVWPQLSSIPGVAGYLRLERGLSGREEAWQYATSLIRDKPWTGYGFLASSELTELHAAWLRKVGFSGIGTTFHNTFVSKAVDLGLVAASLYTLLYVVPLVRICGPSDWPHEQHLIRDMILLTLTTALFRDYNIGGVRSTAMMGTIFLGLANLWPRLVLVSANTSVRDDREAAVTGMQGSAPLVETRMNQSPPAATASPTARRRAANPIGTAKHPLRSAFALFVKELVWRYGIRFSPAKKPICLYASRRSGSTLLMQMMCVNRGVMFSDQPFGLYTASSANINRLPLFPYGQIACPDAEEADILRAYIEDLLAGRIRANLPWKPWSRDFHFLNDRLCLKITDAKAMIDWIDDNFDVDTVVLTRHPFAQVLSVSANQWLITGKGFLRNAAFVEQWLTDPLESFCWDTYQFGGDLERRTVDWALENLPLISLLPRRPHWLYLSYEDVIAHTEVVVRHLSENLQLDDRRAMQRQVYRPSRSTKHESTPETRRWIQFRRQEKLLNAWQERVSPDEKRACFRILERFGIDLYTAESCMPRHAAVGRASFADDPSSAVN